MLYLEKFVECKFSNPVSPKDGYAIPYCKDVRAKEVLCKLEKLKILIFL